MLSSQEHADEEGPRSQATIEQLEAWFDEKKSIIEEEYHDRREAAIAEHEKELAELKNRNKK